VAPRPLSERSKGKRIIALIHGSRGDCQPFVALLAGLQRAGFVVKVITNVNHVEFMGTFGLDAAGPYYDLEQNMRQRPDMKKCMVDGDVKYFVQLMADVTRELYPSSVKHEIEAFEAFKPDLIVVSSICAAQGHMYSCLKNIPAIQLDLVGGVPSGYGVTFAGEPAWFPRWARRLIWRFIGHAQLKAITPKMDILSERLPALRPFVIRTIEQVCLFEEFRPEPILCGSSPMLIKRRPDWPPTRQFSLTGHWIVPPGEQERRMRQGDRHFGGGDERLADFIAAGAAPVYIGWGSMISVSSEHMACLAVRAAKLASVRAVILGGWAELCEDHLRGQRDSEELLAYAASNVLFVKTAAHEWLFPRCAAIVHHGGVGTMAAALRSGRPTIVTPCGFDQPFNATLVQESGAGLGLPRLAQLTPEALAAAIRRTSTDKAMCACARELGRKLQAEDGVARAVEDIDAFMGGEVATGLWAERRARFLVKFRELDKPGLFLRIGLFCLKICTNSLRPLVSL